MGPYGASVCAERPYQCLVGSDFGLFVLPPVCYEKNP